MLQELFGEAFYMSNICSVVLLPTLKMKSVCSSMVNFVASGLSQFNEFSTDIALLVRLSIMAFFCLT